ncbi:hypothetical protein OG989_00475 [Micromonospora sp. NBC_01740]|uniref:hypothetical protein n=1 Tax=Micromonospora sp. NBC_01740 TaxID=2975986 RepID=UPI002E15F1CA|nr:hypothetical protein OG989_00475 [Micromonospora sp. NBC_01740]
MYDLDDIAGGDERRAKALRDALHQLANGRSPLLREMANAVLKGDITLREAFASPTYSDEFTQPFRSFWARYEQMTPETRDQLAAERRGDWRS